MTTHKERPDDGNVVAAAVTALVTGWGRAHAAAAELRALFVAAYGCPACGASGEACTSRLHLTGRPCCTNCPGHPEEPLR